MRVAEISIFYILRLFKTPLKSSNVRRRAMALLEC